jgi:hypothetical protein
MNVILAVDPGYRNLAFVRLECDQKKKVLAIKPLLVDIGPQRSQEGIIMGLIKAIHKYQDLFVNVNHLVIEDQCIGHQTKANNVAISWLVAAKVLELSPTCTLDLPSAKTKFFYFSENFPPAIPLNKSIKGFKRRTIIKNNAVQLAKQLMEQAGINPATVFKKGQEDIWNHIADAMGLGFVKLVSCV